MADEQTHVALTAGWKLQPDTEGWRVESPSGDSCYLFNDDRLHGQASGPAIREVLRQLVSDIHFYQVTTPAPAGDDAKDLRNRCAELVDIHDDAQNNPPEARCYVEGSYAAIVGELRVALAAACLPEWKPDTSQEWARLDGGSAFHMIERHAEDWADTGRMMETWLRARGGVPVELALCEQGRLALKPGQLYRFGEIPGCAQCESLARECESVGAALPVGQLPAARPEPIYQLRRNDGSWIDQTQQSYQYNQTHCANQTRIVYAAPVDQSECQTVFGLPCHYAKDLGTGRVHCIHCNRSKPDAIAS